VSAIRNFIMRTRRSADRRWASDPSGSWAGRSSCSCSSSVWLAAPKHGPATTLPWCDFMQGFPAFTFAHRSQHNAKLALQTTAPPPRPPAPSLNASTVSCRLQLCADRCSPAGRRPRAARRGSPRNPRRRGAARRPTARAASAARRCVQAPPLPGGRGRSSLMQRAGTTWHDRIIDSHHGVAKTRFRAAPRSRRSAQRPPAQTA